MDTAAAAAFELAQQRARADGVGRAHEIRDEARILLLQTLEESLAPLHYAVRDLERRLAAMEERGVIAAPPSPPAGPAARVAPSGRSIEAARQGSAVAIMPPGAVATRAASDPYGAVATVQAGVAPPRGPIPPLRQASSIDIDIPFDGTRRKRRVVALFVLFLLVAFGTLGGAAIMSWMEPH